MLNACLLIYNHIYIHSVSHKTFYLRLYHYYNNYIFNTSECVIQ